MELTTLGRGCAGAGFLFGNQRGVVGAGEGGEVCWVLSCNGGSGGGRGYGIFEEEVQRPEVAMGVGECDHTLVE